MRTHKPFTIIITLIALLTVVPAAAAHRPLWGETTGVTEIPDLDTSFAVYRDLETTTQVDIYEFEAEAGTELYAGVNIPSVRGLEQYGVSVAVLGPGLPPINPQALPAGNPDGLGGIIFPSETGEDFFEPFTQTRYWGRQRIEMTLPKTGTYYLMVWNPAGQVGKYVMDTGRAEVFGPADMFRFPVWWLKVHFFFGHGPYVTGGALLLAAMLTLMMVRRRTQRVSQPKREMAPALS